MKKFILIISSILETIFYTSLMILIESINITNPILDIFVAFIGLLIVSFLFYFLIRFIFQKIGLKSKKYIYYVASLNILIGLIAPVIMIIILPNDTLFVICFLSLLSTICYGIFINVVICFLNYFFTNKKNIIG